MRNFASSARPVPFSVSFTVFSRRRSGRRGRADRDGLLRSLDLLARRDGDGLALLGRLGRGQGVAERARCRAGPAQVAFALTDSPDTVARPVAPFPTFGAATDGGVVVVVASWVSSPSWSSLSLWWWSWSWSTRARTRRRHHRDRPCRAPGAPSTTVPPDRPTPVANASSHGGETEPLGLGHRGRPASGRLGEHVARAAVHGARALVGGADDGRAVDRDAADAERRAADVTGSDAVSSEVCVIVAGQPRARLLEDVERPLGLDGPRVRRIAPGVVRRGDHGGAAVGRDGVAELIGGAGVG